MPVYFIRAGDNGPVKIGRALDPRSRARDLQTSHYEKLSVIRQIPCEGWVEKWFHSYFCSYRIRGEWFQFSPEMLSIEPPKERIGAIVVEKPMTFFAHWRRRVGMTRQEAGASIGRSLRTITAYENDEVPIPKTVRLALDYLERHVNG